MKNSEENDGRKFSVFEYVYRDAGNWKVWGEVLLEGTAKPEDISSFKEALESGEFFIAEQLAIPPLSEKLWSQTVGVNNDDHCWHEYVDLRRATPDEIRDRRVWGSVRTLVNSAKSIVHWEPVV